MIGQERGRVAPRRNSMITRVHERSQRVVVEPAKIWEGNRTLVSLHRKPGTQVVGKPSLVEHSAALLHS